MDICSPPSATALRQESDSERVDSARSEGDCALLRLACTVWRELGEDLREDGIWWRGPHCTVTRTVLTLRPPLRYSGLDGWVEVAEDLLEEIETSEVFNGVFTALKRHFNGV